MNHWILGALVVFVLTSACSKPKNSELSTSSDKQSSINSGAICSKPYNDNPTVEFDEKHLKDNAKGIWDENSYYCGHEKGEEVSSLPEVVLVLGNQDGLSSIQSYINNYIQFWISAAAGSHRKGCIYTLTEANLNRIAQRPNIQKLIFIGHGSQGDLIDTFSSKPIETKSLPKFKSQHIRLVEFYSCQAGQKIEDWRRVFSNSPKVQLNLTSEDVPVFEAVNALEDKIGKIWHCEL